MEDACEQSSFNELFETDGYSNGHIYQQPVNTYCE